LALWTAILEAWIHHTPGKAEPLQFTATFLILTGLLWAAACAGVNQVRNATRALPYAFAGALLIRLISWQVPPVFSDDLLRYRWEGRIQARGLNPYEVRPVDRPDLLRDEDHQLPGRDFKAVYGPLVLLTERWAYQVSGENLPHLRWPFALADLAALLLITWRRGLRGVVTYGWCPLVAFEFWSGGHNDSLCLLALFSSNALFGRQRYAWAWVAVGAAVLTKWWPAMLIPFFAGREAARWRALPWIAAPAVALVPLYWTNPLENAQFASGFVGGWRNNDSLFGGLLWITGGGLPAAKYMAFGLLAGWLAWLLRRDDKTNPILAVSGLLLLSANVHPWYLTWFLPFLCETRVGFVFAWVALAPITFGPAIAWRIHGVWDGVDPWRWLLYLPLFALLGWESWRGRLGTRTLVP
jgi:alpha-1,6-mannosyltransferase